MSISAPCILDIPNEDYHQTPAISKSGLWTLYTRSPAHYRYGKKSTTKSMSFGTVAHTAILEPEKFELNYLPIPDDAPRKPTQAQWSAKRPSEDSIQAMEWWTEFNQSLGTREALSQEDYDNAQAMRDALHTHSAFRRLITGSHIEQSAFWTDEETGELCRVRPDLVNPSLRIMGDLKSTHDPRLWQWEQTVLKYGYHVQEPMYMEGWQQAGGCPIDAFLFIAVEPEPPYEYQLYEIDPSASAEGYAIYRKALLQYHECMKTGIWPGYSRDVKKSMLPRYGYRETTAPSSYRE